MNELLTPGQVVQTVYSAQPCTVERCLGGGGQGEVYAAKWAGGQFALKWYFPHTATPEQRTALERLIQHHRAPSDRFLWPLELAQGRNASGFGYLMRLREPRYKSLLDLAFDRIDPDPTFRALVTAALQLVDSFHKLHADGLCYRDISFGNAFFDPKTGDVLICDNDNVTENRSKVGGVLGTPDFMAPEIVRMEAVPSRQTDLFSLSVLLFYMFHISHPLEGKRVLSIRMKDYPARKKLFGLEPLFIFDPDDKSNVALPRSKDDPCGEAGHNALTYWPIYTQSVRDLFTKSFTTGLRDPNHGRVTEGEWKAALARLRDSIFDCSHCGKQNFWEAELAASGGSFGKECWSCKKKSTCPLRLVVGKTVVMLGVDAKLYPHHLDDHAEVDYSAAVAEVVRHPANPKVLGLKNNSSQRWVATTPDGAVKDIEIGKSIVVAEGTKVGFGKVSGEFQA